MGVSNYVFDHADYTLNKHVPGGDTNYVFKK